MADEKIFYAHTKKRQDGSVAPESDWEQLYTGPCSVDCKECSRLSASHGHLNKVSYWTARFSREMFAPGSQAARTAHDWGSVVGLWHDLGKYSIEFQELLRGKPERVDHSTAGAQHIAETFDDPPVGQLLAYLIAGHHAGLADWNRNGLESDLSRRLANRTIFAWKTHASAELLNVKPLGLPPCQKEQAALFARLLFSCLVDADYLATEAFMNPEQARRRVMWPEDILGKMQAALDVRFGQFGRPSTDVTVQRSAVRKACILAADKDPGLFTLTVPTGGGKTLSSLAFAIKHAIRHNLRRIFYIIPYTSIIEQNADEFRQTFAELSDKLGQDVVLEHHSNFETEQDGTDDQKIVWQLTAENWNAPLIVTTNVQFFESLYANKTSRCRKLHNIPRSVMIFDEAQSLPVEFLHPCLKVLEDLTEMAGCSVVLCTATQPAVGKRKDEFPIGLALEPDREIMPDPRSLYQNLRRVTLRREKEPLSDEILAEQLTSHARVLCIVNTNKHATRLFQQIDSDNPENLHLSAQMCPAHRQSVLAEIHRREKRGEPCRLLATTVVEAGVDIDFPVVYRAITGLDSFAQAAGRCNRHGKYPVEESEVVLFEPKDYKTPSFLIQNVNATVNVLPDHEDLLELDAIKCYFRQYYFLHGKTFKWDKEDILDNFHIQRKRAVFLFDFKTAATKFRLIPQSQKPVIIEPKPGLWSGQDDTKTETVCQQIEDIREKTCWGQTLQNGVHRALQRYTVQVPIPTWDEAVRNGLIQVYQDRFPILIHPENNYDSKLGLLLDANVLSAFVS